MRSTLHTVAKDMRRAARAMMAAVGFALVLVACGGGEDDSAKHAMPPLAQARVDGGRCTDDALAAGRYARVAGECLRASNAIAKPPPAAAVALPLTARELLDWAESAYPALFPAANRAAGTIGDTIQYRHYASAQSLLAVTQEDGFSGIYLFGAVTGWQLSFVGTLADFTCVVRNPCAPVQNSVPKLLFSEVGVALASMPNASRMTRALSVRNTGIAAAGWTASSDQAWLTVTASGTTAANSTSAFNVSANAAMLPADKVSIATVTLTPSSPQVQSPEKLVVGVWKGSTAPEESFGLPRTYHRMVADPVRPYVYLNNNTGSGVDVYHVHKRTLEATIPEVGGVLGGMAVSPDGAYLYVLDTSERAVAVVDLQTRTVKAPLPLAQAASQFAGIAVARPDGARVLLVGNKSAYTLSPWAQAVAGSGDWFDPLWGGSSIAPTADGSRVIFTGRDGSWIYDLAMEGSRLSMTPFAQLASAGGNAAFSLDASRFYTPSGVNACVAWDSRDASAIGMLPIPSWPVTVAVGSDSRIYCGVDGSHNDYHIAVYSRLGAPLRTIKLVTGYNGRLFERGGVAISGDGLAVATLTEAVSSEPVWLSFFFVGP